MSSAERIRRLWPEFRQSVLKSRTLLEHRVEALLDKADKDLEKSPPDRRRSLDQHNAHRAILAKQVRVPHFRSVRKQWELRLQELGLRMEDWTDMSNDEMASVLDVLGNPEDEADVPPILPDIQSPPKQSFSSASLASFVASPPQPVAPSLSSSTRSTNVSTASSYAFVDPSEFHSEEEDSPFFFPVATSYDLTSDDDDRPTHRTQNAFDAWSSDSSSHHSFDRPSNSRFPSSTSPLNGRKMTSAGKQAASLKAKDVSSPKGRQSYVGPIVTDPDEPLSEEEDFERFKMNVRFQKIIQFHQAAAHADIELAIAIYKDRISQNGDNHELSSKVTNHQKRMLQLQMEKEEERKNIVKAERSKRRSELRRRPGRSGTLIAPRPSVPANPSWLNTFQDQVAGEVESNIVLDRILSNDPNEQEGNVEKLLQRMFPGGSSSSNEDEYNHFAPAVSQDEHPSTVPNGWDTSTTSLPRPTGVNHQQTPVNLPKRFSNGRSTKYTNNTRVAKPSLFGEDPESSEEEDSPSPPVSVPAPPQPTESFMNGEADSMLTQHLMGDPEFCSYMNQWGINGEPPNVPSLTTPWGVSQAAQTPTVDNPDPWKMKDVRSTPVATRRKSSFSASLSTPTQNLFNAFMPEQTVPLATLAAFNSANSNAREKQPAVGERRSVLEPVKKFSPPQSVPLPPPVASAAASVPAPPSTSSTSPAMPQAKADTTPAQSLSGKKSNKKQRQAMKKTGTGASGIIEDSTQTPESSVPPGETTPMATIFEQVLQPGNKSNSPAGEANGVGRGRKDSTSIWSELLSTPRPASKIPAHLREAGLKPEGVNKPVEQLRSASGMSTIKAPRGSALKNRTAWSIFSSGEPGPSKPQTEAAGPTGGREPWLPGSFELNDGGGGGEQDNQMVDEASFSGRFFATAPNKLSTSVPVAQQGSRSNGSALSNASNSKAVPQQPSPISPTKKGKNKKGKGKKVSVEEVPEEDEQDSRGDRLPVDHRYIMESNLILEPKPSVPPRMFDSIIGFGDEDEGESTSSSYAAGADTTASSSSSPPPDLFDGDSARMAAAMQELLEGNARMEKRFAATPAWGGGLGNNNNNTSAGSANNRSASNLVNGIPKPPPAIQNLKRSRAASGGKLL